MTALFWLGFMLGAAANAVLTICFSLWQERREDQDNATTTNTKNNR